MTRTGASLVTVTLCLLVGGCSRPAQQGPLEAIGVGLKARDLVERELMLLDERLQMQALDGTLGAGGDAPTQLKSAAQQLLGATITRDRLDGIVRDQEAAARTFFSYVDTAIGNDADPQWKSFAAQRMGEIRASYADAMAAGLDPGPELSSAYVMLARSRGVQGGPTVTPFDNAKADADRLLPTSPSLPPAAAQPVMPIGSA